jgi:hypothetical protein
MQKHSTPPPRSSAGSAAEAVQLAEQALEAALVAGVDTGPARAALDGAREAAAAEQNAVDLAAREVADAEAVAAQQAEAEAIAQTQQQVAEAVETIESAPGADPLPEPVESPAVASAAHRVAQLRRALEQAQLPHHAAIAERGALRKRAQAKKAELDAIRARRSVGDEQAGDATTMTALNMDIEDFTRMLVPAEAAVVATAPTAQQQALVEAENALTAAKRNAEVTGMADRVRLLEAHFTSQVRALRLAAADRGMHNLGSWYRASDDLRKVANGAWL